MPFVGLLASRYKGGDAAAWELIFHRWVRRKQVVWPDEAKAFAELYLAKHPELTRGRNVKASMALYRIFGAYWHGKESFHHGWHVSQLFGLSGVLAGDPCTPKPALREAVFLRLAARRIKDMALGKRHEQLY